MILIDIAKRKGKLLLSDISDTFDMELRDEQDRNKAMRKIKRLIELDILEKTPERIIFVNKRNYPDSAFEIELTKWDQTDSNNSE